MTLDLNALISHIKLAYNIKRRSSSSLMDSSLVKSTSKACYYSRRGNKLHKKQEYDKALLFLQQSVAYASPNNEELAKAYRNRSATLFRMEEYSSSLLDINRALKNHCADALRQNLLNRKERCLAQMKLSLAGGSGNVDNEVDEDATDPSPVDNREEPWRADMLSEFGKNKLLPNASPKIKLKYDKIHGRHFVATADIRPGELLIRERSFVTSVLSQPDSRCDFCFDVCQAMIPCLSCAGVMYCSEKCRTEAYDSYHRMECKLWLLFRTINSTREATAVRMFLVGTEQGAALENLMNTLSISDIFMKNFDFTDKHTDSDYLTGLRLNCRTFDPVLQESLMQNAIEVVYWLEEFGFFESVSSVGRRLEDAEVFATALLLNNFLHLLECNETRSIPVHSDSRHICKKKGSEADFVMLLQYLFNHSCLANAIRIIRKRELVTFALRPVKKDEQVYVPYFSCGCGSCLYGYSFAEISKPERAQYLGFTCLCDACSKNWPTLREVGTHNFMTSKMLFFPMVTNDIRDAYGTWPEPNDPVLSKIGKLLTPLLDDATLTNLRIGEILRIIADVITVFSEIVKPQTISMTKLVFHFMFFINLYYAEWREPDPSQNKNLKFPENVVEEFIDNKMSPDLTCSLMKVLDKVSHMLQMSYAFARLDFYESNVKCRPIARKVVR